jgi:glutamate--cysteine ligase
LEDKLNKIDAYKQYLLDFFKQNSKELLCEQLGVEFEHFLINQVTMSSYQYDEPNGQHELLKNLVNLGWRVIIEEKGKVLAVEKDNHTITLEPGGQVEISLCVAKKIGEIDKAYQSVLGEIKSLFVEDQALVSIGYHPKTKIEELPLLPKTRYKMMYDYFADRGLYCYNMMKGTAATQVSIDYHEEADFITKFRVANFLSPFIARIFDATPIFEGEIYKGDNCRIMVWENTDIERSKLIKGSLDKTFNFADYADFLLRVPPILVQIKGETVFTKGEKLVDLLERFDFNESDYEHFTSMVFPDVRLKRFIEIRMPDALPYPYNIAVPALIKGIFYNQANLNKYYQLSKSFSDDDIKMLNSRLTKEIAFNYKTIDMTTFVLTLLDDAMAALEASEAAYLMPMMALILKDGSMARKLKSLYRDQPGEFISLITV